MNRVIKFRCYETSDMGETYSMTFSDSFDSLLEFFTMTHHDEFLMQYTGLTDKNGVDIYEGDIIFMINKSYSIKLDNMIVKFSKYKDSEQYENHVHLGWNVGEFLLVDCINDGSTCIGNIHETPGLLKKVNNNAST